MSDYIYLQHNQRPLFTSNRSLRATARCLLHARKATFCKWGHTVKLGVQNRQDHFDKLNAITWLSEIKEEQFENKYHIIIPLSIFYMYVT